MEDKDRLIINALQGGFPLAPRPFALVAQKLGMPEEELITRIQSLLDRKIISRFGPMYNPEKMGGAVTLAAIAVPPEEDFERINEIVNSFPEVAHNYEREHKLNMWFVGAAKSPALLARALERIAAQTGLKVYNMPKEKEYFLEAKFEA